jgi:hypothetical protein
MWPPVWMDCRACKVRMRHPKTTSKIVIQQSSIVNPMEVEVQGMSLLGQFPGLSLPLETENRELET